MRKLLWIGDAACSSGFARCTHKTLETLRQTWEVHVLGLNYLGDPHEYPYSIYPCWSGGDSFGVKRTRELVEFLKPDIIVIQNDPWNIKQYMIEIRKASESVPVVATMPVDGKNVAEAEELNKLAHGIFWTEFALGEARNGGFTGSASVVPLGVDTSIYKPQNRAECREALGLPANMLDGFIVGNVNRNQPRKRLDLTIEYFAEWVKLRKIEDAYLFLHVAPTGDQGYDCKQLMRYYGLKGKLILCEPEVGMGETEQDMLLRYGSFNIQVSTTQGEGWGLTTLEGMACGIPQIVPDWSALGEWATAASRIRCDATAVTPNKINVIGGIPAKVTFIGELDRMYRDQVARAHAGERCLELAQNPMFNWNNIGKRFEEILNTVPA